MVVSALVIGACVTVSESAFRAEVGSARSRVESSSSRSSRLAIDFKLLATGASRSTAHLHAGPTISFSRYKSGAWSKPPRSLAASTVIAFAAPVAQDWFLLAGPSALRSGSATGVPGPAGWAVRRAPTIKTRLA